MFNQIIVTGFAGSDPEMRYTPNGAAVANFSVASNRRFTPAGAMEPVEETEWFRVVCWNRLAETVNNYVVRGGKYQVVGRLRTNRWIGQDGQPRFTIEIIASSVLFLDSPRDQQYRAGAQMEPAYSGQPSGDAYANGAGSNPMSQPPQYGPEDPYGDEMPPLEDGEEMPI